MIEECCVKAFGDDIHNFPTTGQLIADHLCCELYQYQCRRFQRLKEAGGEADRHAVIFPEYLPMTRVDRDFTHAQFACTLVNIGLEVIRQNLFRSLVVGVSTRINVANTPAGLQANVPYPASFLAGRYCMGSNSGIFIRVGGLYREGAVNKQHIALVNERYFKVLSEQQRAKACAVYK